VRRTIVIPTCLGLLLSIASAGRGLTPAGPDPAALLRASDRARGAAAASAGMSWSLNVVTKDGDESSEAAYTVKVRGDDALAEVVSPARQRGEKILFNDRTLWFSKPGLRKPVSISPRQKLMGDAANGDIASTRYARDYDGEVVGEETVNGVPSWRLELKARARNVTYDRIRYWISKRDRLGVRAEFLTLAGEAFKTADISYDNAMRIGAETFPFVSAMVIRDSLNTRRETVLRYQTPREEPHAASLFNVNNLAR